MRFEAGCYVDCSALSYDEATVKAFRWVLDTLELRDRPTFDRLVNDGHASAFGLSAEALDDRLDIVLEALNDRCVGCWFHWDDGSLYCSEFEG